MHTWARGEEGNSPLLEQKFKSPTLSSRKSVHIKKFGSKKTYPPTPSKKSYPPYSKGPLIPPHRWDPVHMYVPTPPLLEGKSRQLLFLGHPCTNLGWNNKISVYVCDPSTVWKAVIIGQKGTPLLIPEELRTIPSFWHNKIIPLCHVPILFWLFWDDLMFTYYPPVKNSIPYNISLQHFIYLI